MDSSHSEVSAVIRGYNLPVGPPVAIETANQAEHEQHLISRRRLLTNVAKMAGGAIVSGSVLGKFDDYYTSSRWPDSEAAINLADGAEKVAVGGAEWLVFGGFGQQDSHNAAQELFYAMGKQQAVAGVHYPSHEFGPDTLAQVIHQHIVARKITQLNIVGVSMGLPTALMSLRSLELQERRLAQQDRLGPKQYLPDINYMVGYSSPADLQDAMRGELAQTFINLAGKTAYKPGAFGKFLYSMFDNPGDLNRVLDVGNHRQEVAHLTDSIRQTTNGCPPIMAWSQLKNFLVPFNLTHQWRNYRSVFQPNVELLYVSPTNYDTVVNDQSARQNYSDVMHWLGNKRFTDLPSGNVGHANTIASANVVAKYLEAIGVLLNPLLHKI